MSQSRNEKSIVVGIDFGTTYSGVSWAFSGTASNIRLIQDWPNPIANNANSDKVPSKISYQEDGQVKNWGYEVKTNDDHFHWMKVLLEPDSEKTKATEAIKQCNTLLEKLNKTLDNVVSDYLRAIWIYTKEDIRKRVDEDDWETTYTIRVVLTVPAVWSQTAKYRTHKAAIMAGLSDKIQLVTEPEAAALATLSGKAETSSLKTGDVFVVCDAGGGTVDLISYEIKSTEPLLMGGCVPGAGDLCGSVFLNIAFTRYIKTLVGETQYEEIKPRNKIKMEAEFEIGPKRRFRGDSSEFTVDLVGVKNDEENGISEDVITLKPGFDQVMFRTAIQGLFDDVCGRIDNLVDNQIRAVEMKDLKVKAILLVGGFGENKYLHQRLETTYRSKEIRVMQVNGSWSAICRGATMWGLANPPQQPADRNGWYGGRYGEQPQRPTSPTPIKPSHSPESTEPSQTPRFPPQRPVSPQAAPLDHIKAAAASKISISSFMPPSPHGRTSLVSYGVARDVPFDEQKHEFQDRQWNPVLGIHEAANQMIWLIKRNLIYKKAKTIKGKADRKKWQEVYLDIYLKLDYTGIDYEVGYEGIQVGEGGCDYFEEERDEDTSSIGECHKGKAVGSP
ncbi:hypothetical protein N0V82_006543 [Gnomoniopsis sp. IMI 355080]|nr:hypothetical protein N0V82_006543 [Gnomoniopsis sp. IMI 355080]